MGRGTAKCNRVRAPRQASCPGRTAARSDAVQTRDPGCFGLKTGTPHLRCITSCCTADAGNAADGLRIKDSPYERVEDGRKRADARPGMTSGVVQSPAKSGPKYGPVTPTIRGGWPVDSRNFTR